MRPGGPQFAFPIGDRPMVQLCGPLAGNPRWRARGLARWIAQLGSAVGTVDVIYTNRALALWTNRAQPVTAVRAEAEPSCTTAALYCGQPQWSCSKKNDAQSVGNNSQNCPKGRAMPRRLASRLIADNTKTATQTWPARAAGPMVLMRLWVRTTAIETVPRRTRQAGTQAQVSLTPPPARFELR
jgi:hypothetical protein